MLKLIIIIIKSRKDETIFFKLNFLNNDDVANCLVNYKIIGGLL